ncbi:hypothetical protein [Chitinophaga defluvii]|uniref:Uncharacterized protein n=1 Tax=Chitinophaga defluvii TaxID=3163343 RepID=A0ABV2T9W1_9BACT
MNNNQSTIENRLERDLAVWDRIQARQVERYGKDVLKDRGFLAAKREMYKHIMQKYIGKRPNAYEKAEMRVLRSQQRKLLRQMYPNPLVRLLRNILALNVNLVRLAGRMTIGAVRGAVAVLTGQQRKPAPSKQYTAARQTPPASNRQTRGPQVGKPLTQDNSAVVRKLPHKPRIVPRPAKSKGVRR